MTWVWHLGWWREQTLIPDEWLYDLGVGDALSVGEWGSRCGPIFGRSVVVLRPPGAPRRIHAY